MYIDNVESYVAIKAIERLYNYLVINKYLSDSNIQKFINLVFLNKTPLIEINSLENHFENMIVDFEDANILQAKNNYIYICILDFISYLEDRDDEILENIINEITDFYRNIAEDEYMDKNGLSAIINDQKVDEIEKNEILLSEKKSQQIDRIFGNNVTDWSNL